MRVLYRCARCDFALDPDHHLFIIDGFGWVCARCLTDDEVEGLR